MKLTLIFLAAFASSLSSYAQCEVKVYTSQGTPVYQAQFEELYKNIGKNNDGDYGYGFQKVYVSVTASGKNKGHWSLFVGVSTHGAYPNVLPRQIRLSFSSGQVFEKTASNHNTRDGLDIYEFELPISEEILVSSPVEVSSIGNFTVLDNRTGESISGMPLYSDILKEQIQCVRNK